jgi:hypothetical protein
MDIKILKGMTLSSVVMNKGKDEIIFTTTTGRKFCMNHVQDCCEHVSVEDICGELSDLVGSPLLQAEESVNDKGYKPQSGDDSFTWTFYRLATIKGQVVIRWYGSSNGYYSESVYFEEITPAVVVKPKKQSKKPKKQPRYFTTPDGKDITSVRVYLKEWNKILKPLEKLTGLKVYGFDPSISLAKIENGKYVMGSNVQIPLWFAKLLVNKFQSLNESLDDYRDRGIIHED